MKEFTLTTDDENLTVSELKKILPQNCKVLESKTVFSKTAPNTTSKKSKFRRWLVVSKTTLLRGYGWTQVPLLGIIAAGTLKSAFPGAIDSFSKFAALSVLGFIVLYTIGYVDKKYRFFHEESDYAYENSPHMMKVINSVGKEKEKEEERSEKS